MNWPRKLTTNLSFFPFILNLNFTLFFFLSRPNESLVAIARIRRYPPHPRSLNSKWCWQDMPLLTAVPFPSCPSFVYTRLFPPPAFIGNGPHSHVQNFCLALSFYSSPWPFLLTEIIRLFSQSSLSQFPLKYCVYDVEAPASKKKNSLALDYVSLSNEKNGMWGLVYSKLLWKCKME